MRHFASQLLDRGCWTFHRHSVTRAFALGLFIAFIPPTPLLPVHLVTCLVLGLIFRLNLPVLVATVFVSNPLTWLPQVMGSIWVGAKLLDIDLVPFFAEFTRDNFWDSINELWGPLFLGALVLGITAALVGYFMAQAAWRARVAYQLKRRRARSNARPAALD